MHQYYIYDTFLSLSLRPASPAYALPLCRQRAVDKWPYALGGVCLSSVSKFRISGLTSHDQGIIIYSRRAALAPGRPEGPFS